MKALLLIILTGVFPTLVLAAPDTGKAAAMKYFTGQARRPAQVPPPAPQPPAHGQLRQSIPSQQPGDSPENLLGITVGSLLQSRSHGWIEDDFAGWSLEAQYVRQGEGWLSRGYHVEMQKFSHEDSELTKVSFLMSFIFPRRLDFPVFMAVAAGPGYFFNQISGSSEFALDYRAYAGFRFNGSYGQYFLQSGVKNHVHVLDSGQFVGWFFSSGVAYTF